MYILYKKENKTIISLNVLLGYHYLQTANGAVFGYRQAIIYQPTLPLLYSQVSHIIASVLLNNLLPKGYGRQCRKQTA